MKIVLTHRNENNYLIRKLPFPFGRMSGDEGVSSHLHFHTRRKIGGVFECCIFQPKDIEVEFVAFEKIFVAEAMEAFAPLRL